MDLTSRTGPGRASLGSQTEDLRECSDVPVVVVPDWSRVLRALGTNCTTLACQETHIEHGPAVIELLIGQFGFSTLHEHSFESVHLHAFREQCKQSKP